jgi:hypothetical protein
MKRIQIQYTDDPLDEEENPPPVEAVEEAIAVEAETLPTQEDTDQTPDEPIRTTSEHEPNTDYIFKTRVGTLELINYLPRVPGEVIQGERDFTPDEWAIASEDFNRGFRPIEERYLTNYQVPDDSSQFRTQEDLSRNIIKLSSRMVSKWVKTTMSATKPRFPERLLKDDFGFTQYAVAVYRNLMQYTCTRRFTAPWDSIDRDSVPSPIKDPNLSEENPDYALSSIYWEKLADQWQDYRELMSWLEEYKKLLSLKGQEPEVMDFEGESDRVLATQLSQFAAKVELAKQAALQYLDQELEDMNLHAVKKAKSKGAKGRAMAVDAYAEAFSQGDSQAPPEEEDLWSEN